MSAKNDKYNHNSMKVPVLLPSGHDARMVAGIVGTLRHNAVICNNMDQMVGHIDPESGLFIIGDEVLTSDMSFNKLTTAIKEQPEWSDIPGIIVTGQADNLKLSEELEDRREIVLIQGPVRKSVFANMIKTAVEIRRRQFQVRDLIDDLVRANETLSARTTKLQNLALEMTRVEDRERRRISQILHDDLQQMLASARLQTEMLFDDLEGEARKRGQTIYGIISQAMQTARNLSHELNPVVSSRDRLDHSLKELADRMSGNYSFKIKTALSPVDENISYDVKRFVYRSVQELLFNCIKHARASHATLKLASQSRRITVTVTDDGKGFDPGRLKIFGGNNHGFGLFSIYERVLILDGALDIYSRPDKGTRFLLTVPY